MRKYLLFLLALLGTATASADDLSLYIEPTSGETTSHEVATLQKMTFESGNVVLTRKDGTTVTTAIADIARLYFSQTATAINAAIGTQPAPYTIHSLNGIAVAQGTAATAADIDTSRLPGGIYIVSIHNQNFKILKR